jgi:enamine deaminase RidA (YjgF/YER057c/UK114 family)
MIEKEAQPRILLPQGWPKPKGYVNGLVTKGTFVFLGGQIGWNESHIFPSGFVAQTRQALSNIVRLLNEADARPQHVVRLVWYVTDLAAYSSSLKDIGNAYRTIFGYHYPPMTLVQVVKLVEPDALVEIEATAVIPE